MNYLSISGLRKTKRVTVSVASEGTVQYWVVDLESWYSNLTKKSNKTHIFCKLEQFRKKSKEMEIKENDFEERLVIKN